MADQITPHPFRLVPVMDLKPGDMLDLQHDTIADPHGNVIELASEYATVDDIDPETDACVAVCIARVDTFGFPPGHLVKMVGHDSRYDAPPVVVTTPPPVAHTPGPWDIVKAGSFGWNIRANWHGEPDCQLAYVDAGVRQTRGPFADESAANARLIAAAPDLLAALKSIVAVSGRKTDGYDQARAAIAKAEGSNAP